MWASGLVGKCMLTDERATRNPVKGCASFWQAITSVELYERKVSG